MQVNRASLLASLDLAIGVGLHARVVALTAGLAPVMRRDGPWPDAVARYTEAIAAARQTDDRLGEGNALVDLGEVQKLAGDSPIAAEIWEQALSVNRRSGDRLGEANSARRTLCMRLPESGICPVNTSGQSASWRKG